MSVASRTFGVELELFMPRGKTHAELAQHLVETANVNATAPGYTHRVTAAWKVITDASLGSYDTGAEIVSPVLKGRDGFEQTTRVCQALVAFGCKVTVKCGFHIHIGASDFSVDEMAALMINYVWFEDFFDHIVPPSRRRDLSQWVASNRARFSVDGERYGTKAVNNAFVKIKAALEASKTATNSGFGYMPVYGDGSPRNIAMESLIYSFAGTNRYQKLNLVSGYLPYDQRPGNKCVEFRQHSGTIDADKVVNWIKLHLAFVEKSKVSRPRPRTVERDLKPIEEMNRFFAYIPCEPEVKAFYMERRKELAKEETAATAQAAADLADGETIARRMIDQLRVRIENGNRRNHRIIVQRCSNAIADLEHAMSGRHTRGGMTTATAIAAAIARVRASNLIPAE